MENRQLQVGQVLAPSQAISVPEMMTLADAFEEAAGVTAP